ncbi:hypothetical protein Bhyg_10730 [Pseudolycoriella hygida]|uniref:Uncharacterized protein n=1 Tax=Pseudolycoriella hygida TaxID=35572 RepID=A0A9Q0RZL2_9DIPT|nr:hypothetical protein Bhyg_10730 [Pseudolycoriella hygida]
MTNAAAIASLLLPLTFLLIGTAFGQLYTDEVSDGKCTNNTVAANFTACLPLILIPRVFTVNFASNALYRNFAESFLGRPANDETELDAMCYKFAFIEALVVQTGYGNKSCIRTAIPTDLDITSPFGSPPFGFGKFKVETTLAQSTGSTLESQYKTVDQVIWCDLNHLLLVRCVNGVRQDWELASVADPEPWVLPLVLDIIQGLGMPPENAVRYESVSNGGTCPDAPNLLSFTIQAAKNVGVPIPISGSQSNDNSTAPINFDDLQNF